MTRDQAHSLYDELPPIPVYAEPIITSWRDALAILGQAALLGAGLFTVIVLLLTLAAPAPAVAP